MLNHDPLHLQFLVFEAGEDAPRHDGKSVHQVGVVEVVLMTEDPEVQKLGDRNGFQTAGL